jgi:hypothetical protein
MRPARPRALTPVCDAELLEVEVAVEPDLVPLPVLEPADGLELVVEPDGSGVLVRHNR